MLVLYIIFQHVFPSHVEIVALQRPFITPFSTKMLNIFLLSHWHWFEERNSMYVMCDNISRFDVHLVKSCTLLDSWNCQTSTTLPSFLSTKGGCHLYKRTTKGVVNRGWYTRYCIQCHIILYVTLVTFLVTLLMNKFTSVIIPTYIFVEYFRIWYILHAYIFVMKKCHE